MRRVRSRIFPSTRLNLFPSFTRFLLTRTPLTAIGTVTDASTCAHGIMKSGIAAITACACMIPAFRNFPTASVTRTTRKIPTSSWRIKPSRSVRNNKFRYRIMAGVHIMTPPWVSLNVSKPECAASVKTKRVGPTVPGLSCSPSLYCAC